jgi:hypothetical protein
LHFYLDVLERDRVSEDLETIDCADCETAIAEAVKAARKVVAHGIMLNEDESGSSFVIWDGYGKRL